MGHANDAVHELAFLALETEKGRWHFSGEQEHGHLISKIKGPWWFEIQEKERKNKLYLELTLKPSCASRQLGVFKGLGLKLI